MRSRALAIRLLTPAILLICLALGAPAQVDTQSGAPAISSFSGALQHGATLSISGTRFGTKPQAAPFKYDDFQSVPIGQKIATSTAPGLAWEDFEQPVDPLATAGRLRPGTPFTRNMESRWRSTDNIGTSSIGWKNRDFRKLLLDFWVYHDTSRATNGDLNTKFWRLHAANGFNMYPNWYAVTEGDSAALQLEGPEWAGGWFGSNGRPPLPGSEAYNRWQHYTYVLDFGTGNGAPDGFAYVYRDGALRQSYLGKAFTGPGQLSYSDLYIGHYLRTGGDYAGEHTAHWESVYVDTSIARVEIGNSSTYANSNHREIQIPTAWSDGSITVTLNRGSFTSLSGLYLFVVNNQNVASQGFPLSNGNNLPPAPNNLRIQGP